MLSELLAPHRLPEPFVTRRVNGIRELRAGETVTLADVSGPGCLRHLFFTLPPRNLREMILRIAWDDEPAPSIECPLSDFFGIGHDLTTADFRSSLFYVAPKYGYNCYIPMPFARRARITVTNESANLCPAIYIMLGYQEFEGPVPPWRLHAAWRRVFPAYRRGAPLTLLEAKGEGRLLGLIYHICKRDSDDRWSHGGGDQMFIDGETAKPSYLYGVGGEDFAHHAWGLYPALGPYSGAHYIHPVPGVKRPEGQQAFEPHGWEQHDGGQYSMYRYFIPDPVRFRHSIRMTFGTCANEISGTTYWYQTEPHAPFCALPPVKQRAFGARLAEEATWKPIDLGQEVPTAVLGPMMFRDVRANEGPDDLRAPGGTSPWRPEDGADLSAVYETDVRQPYGDVVRPPYHIRWRRCTVRGGFVDLAGIHRPKCGVRARGLWNYRHLPRPALSYQLIRIRASAPRELILRVGYEDRLLVWHNGRQVAALNRPEPEPWRTDDVKLALAALDVRANERSDNPRALGVNDIVIGNSQERLVRWSAWAIYVKFLDPDGRVAEGLDFEPFDALPPTPERWREPWPPDGEVPCDDYRDPAFLV